MTLRSMGAVALLAALSACSATTEKEEPVDSTKQELGYPTVCGYSCPPGYAAIGRICDIFCGSCPYGPYLSYPNATECVPTVPPTPKGNISAEPETVSVPTGGLGNSRICYSSNVEYSEVYVSMDGQPESLFMMERREGCSNAPWIQIGHSYTFTVYAGQQHSNALASVTVTGVDGGTPPDPCSSCRPGTSCRCGDNVCWPNNRPCR